ncbi:MAG: serine--tRNA ligase, partial [Cyanobacteriota bacterium]
MLDLKLLRDHPERVHQALRNRRATVDLDGILNLDRQRRQLETRRGSLQAESNSIGKKVGDLIRQGADPQGSEVAALRQRGVDLKAEIAQLEQQERQLEEQIQLQLLTLPNLPLPIVPIGQDERENREIRRWGDELKPTHSVLPHDEIAEKWGLLDFGRAVKVAQSR